MTDIGAGYTFGRDDLGPAIAGYLSRLHTHILAFEQEHGARALFVSRAGIRIRRALDVFVRATKLPAPATGEFFWISRLVVARGVWNRKPEASIDVLSKEYRHINLAEFVRGMFRFAPSGARLNPVDPSLVGNGADLGRFLASGSKIAEVVQTLFRHQSMLLEGYIKQLLGSSGTALLIDTGWQATAQTLLAKAYPEYEWWGAYFGRSGFPTSDRSEWGRAFGLVFEADAFDPKRPETSPILNRHLIEFLFEPKGDSIQWLAQEERGGQIIAPGAPGILADAPTRDSDPMFVGVLDYLESLPEGIHLADLRAAEAAAWQRIASLLVHPSKDGLAAFANVTRSADFGRDARVPLLPKPEPRFDGDTPDRRIQDSLWPCGQAAIEYPPEMAHALQKRLGGDLKAATAPERTSPRTRPAVAIITRTMDRPMFLERALKSVAAQTYQDYVHIVVNDGGDNDAVKATIDAANCDHARVRLVDAVKNRGMEAASNLAIRNSDSDYVVIHDDDDSWEPEFLRKTVTFLDGKQGKPYAGVITKSTYVSEEVTPKGIAVHARAPYNGWVENVHLMEMAIANFFPPIAFLFRRDMYDKLGGYDERYPVLGDWDFNLRFLVEGDIAVVHEPLANYHHRDRGDTTTFGNSVIAARAKHLEFSSIVRNNLVRSLAQRGHAAAATLAGVGLFFEDQRNTLRAADNRMTQLGQRIAASASSSAWTDHYWVAFQHLLKSVVENDAAALERIRANAVRGQAGLLARVGMASPAQGPARPADLDRAAAALLRDQFARDSTTLDAIAIPPDFDDAFYLRQNPDVAAAVAEGKLSSGYDHYIRYGRREGRTRPAKLH